MAFDDMVSRRSLVKACGCGAAALATVGAAHRALASTAPPADVIDVHYHITTERMRRVANNAMTSAPVANLPTWTQTAAIADMDRDRVATSVISMPVVSVTLPSGERGHADFARGANEDAAHAVSGRPDRFRFFAFLPLPYTEVTLKEIAYALDTLKADGVYMCTSYGDRWLGDPIFAPVMDELNRRGAVVFTHPMGAACCVSQLVAKVPSTVIEYGTDTARSVASLIFNGATRRYPRIKFIFSHAGGTAPYVFQRFDWSAATDRAAQAAFPEGARAALGHFYYDTAQSVDPYALGLLAKLVPPTQILYGSDSPWRSPGLQLAALDRMNLGDALTAAIRQDNARRVLPGLYGRRIQT